MYCVLSFFSLLKYFTNRIFNFNFPGYLKATQHRMPYKNSPRKGRQGKNDAQNKINNRPLQAELPTPLLLKEKGPFLSKLKSNRGSFQTG